MKVFVLFFVSLALYFNAFSQNNAYVIKRALWTRTDESGAIKISVCWDNPNSQYERWMKVVQEAILNTWQKNSALLFTDWSAGNRKGADIHILIKDSTPHTLALGTLLRYKEGGVVLNFDFKNFPLPGPNPDTAFYVKSIAIHEFGHVLGFSHEQNRKDCVFKNCILKEQGDEGDYTLSHCDTFSVMNYCNPRYCNDGFLSDLDKHAVRELFGLPPEEKDQYHGLQLIANSRIINPDPKSGEVSREFKLYISGNEKDLSNINHVLYYLDPNWFKRRHRENIVRKKQSNFGLGLRLRGPVHVVAFIFLKGDDELKEVVIPKYLSF